MRACHRARRGRRPAAPLVILSARKQASIASAHEESAQLVVIARKAARRGPGGARGASGSTDSQTLMVRRTIALGGAILLVIILLVVGLNSCLDSRKDRAFRDYASDVRAIVRGSNDVSQRLFDLLSSPQRADALDVQTQVNAERADAEQLVQRARDTDHPDELDGAHAWLVEALQFRADAIEKIAAALPEALGDRARLERRDQRDRGPDAGAARQRRDLPAAHDPRRWRPPTRSAASRSASRPTASCPTSAGSIPTPCRRGSAGSPATSSQAATPGPARHRHPGRHGRARRAWR